MTPRDNVVYLRTGQTPSAYREIVERLRAGSIPRLRAIVRAALDRVDDALFDRAERAGSPGDQEMYFAAMRQMRLRRQDVEPAFAKRMEAAFEQLFEKPSESPSEAEPDPDAGDLELMDDAMVEEEVAIDTMVSRVRGRCSLPLSRICDRLDRLVGERAVTEDCNPLDPSRIAAAFSAAMADLQVEIQPRLIVYKLFEKELLARLPELYETADRQLADEGVSSSPGAARGPDVDDPGEPDRTDEEVEGPTLDLLRRLLAEARGAGAADAEAERAPADPEEIVRALSSLQFRSLGGQEAPGVSADASTIKGDLQSALGPVRAGRGLDRGTGDTIDIVSMLFEYILDDPRLPDAVKVLVGRLQIPVLKVAFLDGTFFSSRRHPARRLINEMAYAAAGWNEPDDLAGDLLYRKMREVVERIVDGFEQDVGLFETVLRDFRSFVEREQERARAIEERTRQAAEGKARVDGARERVQEEVERRLAVDDLPEVVRRLLQEAWFKVLFITLVREGEESERWHRQLAVMDRLIWSVRIDKSAEERKRMLTEMPGLLQDLREGLNAIMFNPFEMTRLFKALEQEHIRCLSVPPTPSVTEAPAPPYGEPARGEGEDSPPAGAAGPSGPDPEDAVPAEEPDEVDGLPERLRGTELGTWFVFREESGREMRAKLSARLNGGTRFIFVNRAGFKLADKTLETLSAELRSGRTVMLDDSMLFERALENVIASLHEDGDHDQG